MGSGGHPWMAATSSGPAKGRATDERAPRVTRGPFVSRVFLEEQLADPGLLTAPEGEVEGRALTYLALYADLPTD